MPSLLPGYTYDIFISYRHKDNKGDRWVTEFVDALKAELESTFKEDISIYFDTNPHDGLTETHHVGKSLEEKLRCVILIPIISQTYCDPKSFAWQHEFCAFNRIVQQDANGRLVRVVNGNVADRILPVRIHDLDADDKALLEAELGGPLRSVDFIFRSLGVNRPLRAHEDHPQENANKTNYRDQINKVANAIKNIVNGMKHPDTVDSKAPVNNVKPQIPETRSRKPFVPAIVGAVLIIFAALYFLYQRNSVAGTEEIDKSVAVLAFDDLSPGKDQSWFSDGLTEEILNSLTNVGELKVTARTSAFFFKDKHFSLNEIADKLAVAHVVQGSVTRIDNQLRITAKLIRTKDGFQIWSQKYDRTSDDLFKVQSDIAENIAKELLHELTPEKAARLETTKPSNVEAYEYYLRGMKAHSEYWLVSGVQDFEVAERYFLKAIALDPNYAEAYGALADLYDTRSNVKQDQIKFRYLRDSVIQIGHRLNPNSVQTLVAIGLSFTKREAPDLDSAFFYFKKAYSISPDEVQTAVNLADFYLGIGLPDFAVRYYLQAYDIDPLDMTTVRPLAHAYHRLANYTEAKKYFNKLIELEDVDDARFWLAFFALIQGDRQEATKHFNVLKQKSHDSPFVLELQNMFYASEGKRQEALKTGSNQIGVLSLLKMKKEFVELVGSYPGLDPDGVEKNTLSEFVRDDPQFKLLIRRLRATREENLKKYGRID